MIKLELVNYQQGLGEVIRDPPSQANVQTIEKAFVGRVLLSEGLVT